MVIHSFLLLDFYFDTIAKQNFFIMELKIREFSQNRENIWSLFV